jgi:hypothetical protein
MFWLWRNTLHRDQQAARASQQGGAGIDAAVREMAGDND